MLVRDYTEQRRPLRLCDSGDSGIAIRGSLVGKCTAGRGEADAGQIMARKFFLQPTSERMDNEIMESPTWQALMMETTTS